MDETDPPVSEVATSPVAAQRAEERAVRRADAKPMPRPEANPNLLRDRLANERTFLAWLRTGIAITSLGFVVARFDIFLTEFARISSETAPAAVQPPKEGTAAVPIGVLLVLAGPLIIVMAAVRYLHTERALLAGRPDSRWLVRNIVIAITAGSAIAGLGLTIHLLGALP